LSKIAKSISSLNFKLMDMAKFNASLNMIARLVQNTNRHNKAKKIYNDMTNVPCQRRWYSYTHFHKIMPIVT
jgi:hypothetical protein